MSKIVKNSNSKYGYDFITDDNEVIQLTSKTTDNYFKLPVMVNGRKMISLTWLNSQDSNEIDLSTLPQRNTNVSTNDFIGTKPKASRVIVDIAKYLDPQDAELFGELLAKATKRQQIEELRQAIEKATQEIEMLEQAEIDKLNALTDRTNK